MHTIKNGQSAKKSYMLIADEASVIFRLLDTSVLLSMGQDDELELSTKLVLLAQKKISVLEQECRNFTGQESLK